MQQVSVSVDVLVRALHAVVDGHGATIDRAYPYDGQNVAAALVFDDELQWPRFLDQLPLLDSEGRRVGELLRHKDARARSEGKVVHYFPGVRFQGAPCVYDEGMDG